MTKAVLGPPGDSGCEHTRRAGCVYCPTCGTRYPQQRRKRGLLGWLLAPFALWARLEAGASATPDLDASANRDALRSGDPERMRRALGFLVELGSRADSLRSDVEACVDHSDRDIALRARDVLAAMGTPRRQARAGS